MDKLIQKRNVILLSFACILLVLSVLSFAFGEEEDKVKLIVLTVILPFVIYGFARLIYKVVRINASLKIMKFFFSFFLVCGTLGTVFMTLAYIASFPSGLSPALGASMGLIIATLDAQK